LVTGITQAGTRQQGAEATKDRINLRFLCQLINLRGRLIMQAEFRLLWVS
jgi:hypothetical protein